jgi:hypothetical protein
VVAAVKSERVFVVLTRGWHKKTSCQIWQIYDEVQREKCG